MYKDEKLPREIINLMKQYKIYLSKNNNIINLDVYDENYSKLLTKHKNIFMIFSIMQYIMQIKAMIF